MRLSPGTPGDREPVLLADDRGSAVPHGSAALIPLAHHGSAALIPLVHQHESPQDNAARQEQHPAEGNPRGD